MANEEQLQQDENQIMAERRAKLSAIREKGIAFPNDFRPANLAADLHARYDSTEGEVLTADAIEVSVAGRMMLKRVMGKASFATVQDSSGQIQFYISRDAVGEETYASFKHWDLGDILGARSC